MKLCSSAAAPRICRDGSHQSSFFRPTSPTRFGGTPFILHTTSITNLTPSGGLWYLDTSWMSLTLRFFRTLTALSSPGSARFRTSCAAAPMLWHSSAFAAASASSIMATSRCSSDWILSTAICSIITWMSSWVLMSMGCECFSVCCSTSTCSSVCRSFSSPFRSFSLYPVTPACFSRSSLMNIPRLVRKAVGVT